MIGKIIALIITVFGMLLLGLRKALGWNNLDPNACTTFYTASMIAEYENPGSAQFFAKVANNLGYNYREVWERWNEKGWGWKNLVPPGGEVDFATGFTFDQRYFQFWEEVSDETKIRYLTTTYQSFVTNFDIKSLATGGFRIKNTAGGNISVRIGWARFRDYGEGTTVP